MRPVLTWDGWNGDVLRFVGALLGCFAELEVNGLCNPVRFVWLVCGRVIWVVLSPGTASEPARPVCFNVSTLALFLSWDEK